MSAQDKTSLKLLEEAMAQRARCFLSLPVSVTGVRELDCAMLESSTRGLLLESQGKAACGPHWMGLDVTGYFRVILRRNGIDETFYTFDSRIKAAANGRTGIARLLLEEPDSLVFGQRRKSLRVEPDIERIAAAFLWRYDKKEGFVMDCPALRRVDFQGGLARIADISAGGMRLTVRSCASAAWNCPRANGWWCTCNCANRANPGTTSSGSWPACATRPGTACAGMRSTASNS